MNNECIDDMEVCGDCGCEFDSTDFDYVEDVFDEDAPTCVNCQRETRIANETCDCGEPAEYEVEAGYLCEYHYQHYLDGYIRD